MRNLVFIDTETTGFSPTKHFIHQLAGEIWEDNTVLHSFDFKVRPPFGYEIHDKALEVSNTTKLQLMNYPLPKDTHLDFVKTLHSHKNNNDKFTFVAYNAKFDFRFVHAFFRYCKDESFLGWFYPEPLDIKKEIDDFAIQRDISLPSLKLTEVAKFFGIRTYDAHQAYADVYMMVELYKMMKKNGHQFI